MFLQQVFEYAVRIILKRIEGLLADAFLEDWLELEIELPHVIVDIFEICDDVLILTVSLTGCFARLDAAVVEPSHSMHQRYLVDVQLL